MSSDTSDEENLAQLREATDAQFISDSLFKQKSSAREQQKQPLESLRRAKDEDEQYNLFRVTPEFRKHVAKHLSKILDNIIERKISYKAKVKDHKGKKRKGGVKLFTSSTEFVKSKSSLTDHNIKPTYKPQTNGEVESDKMKFEKCQSVAVAPEDILSGKETQFWSNRSKAPVYKYKKTDTGLLELP